ncbi:MAG: GNAT family N-acetyltransferase [Alphaproteobacteria bacterium]|nr:GNAT family N-acetyltransferase [Alphaproteobacteria bacterium]
MISISNLKKKEDLTIIAGHYANYYNNSVLNEKWTKEKVVELFRYFYNQYPDLFFVAYDDDKPVGVIMSALKPWWDGNHLEDGEVFVLPSYRRMGIAKLLFKALFKYAVEKFNATTLLGHTYEDENGFPYSWYKRLGFETINDWKIISCDIKEIMKKI